MNVERVTYLDSSAIVRLAEVAPETSALRQYLRRRRPYISSALAHTEVMRTLLPRGPEAVRRGNDVLLNIDLVRVSDRVLKLAGELPQPTLRSLEAIHLTTAQLLGGSLARLVTYDERMLVAARLLGVAVASPG
jgi:predicted nucleic acid-binding protein